MRIALYEPDIPQNVGATIRLCACLGIGLDIIEPCGFLWTDKKMGRVAMDYKNAIMPEKHLNWAAFREARAGRRVVLMTTKASMPYPDFEFRDDDILLAGRESSGAPENIHAEVEARVLIPMSGGLRSLNIVNATAMITGEALRQTRWSAEYERRNEEKTP